MFIKICLVYASLNATKSGMIEIVSVYR